MTALMALAPLAARTKVVTTIFPAYDWAREVIGTNDAEITMLLDNGVDLHSYQPTVQDIAKISTCDVFVYVGGESDGWVEDALKTARNKNMQVVNLMEVMGSRAKAEEVKEGMEADHHEHNHEEHSHSKHVSTFDNSEVKDRSLSDWAGKWQSPYPLVLDGTLDEAWEAKAAAEGATMTASQYKAYYEKGYKSDIKAVEIKGTKITFTYTNGKRVSSKYKYVGYYIQNWSTGTKAAMYRFESTNKKSGAPVYIEFNDHMIEPAKAEHFHLRMSDTSFDAIEDPENRWPTFFPAEMSGEEIADHLGGHAHHHDEEEEELDEHVWLSLKNAQLLTNAICNALVKADSKNAASYKANCEAYNRKIAALDAEYTAAVRGAAQKTLVFCDRFPFRYLVDDYGLDYFAAFVGCSAETEASFKTVAFLANKSDELGIKNVAVIESSDKKIAQTVIQNSKNKSRGILVFDSMQSTTANDVKKGTTYLSVMRKNLEVLKSVLR